MVGSFRPRPPTHDELGDALIKEWDGNVAFLYGTWYRYEFGAWRPSNLELDFWEAQIKFKHKGIEPTSGRCKSIEHYCRARLRADEVELSAGDHYINLQGSLFNLSTRQPEPHNRALYMTHQLAFHYDPFAVCPLFEWWLDQVIITPEGQPDRALQRLIQEAWYYSLTASTDHRASFWVFGPKGSGKSTLVNILIALSGNMHTSINLDQLNDAYTLAKIAGKRLVTFSEPDGRTPLNAGMFKKLVSKDHVPARQIYGVPFDFVPICKLWGSMNDLPPVIDRSGAAFDRMVMIPFHRPIPKEQRDGTLEDRLLGELPGIFNWVMNGAGRLKQQGRFTAVEQSQKAVEKYQEDNDNEWQWVQERSQPGGWVSQQLAYTDYRGWCADVGIQPKGRNNFGRDLERLGYERQKGENGILVKGLSLKNGGMF